MLRKRHLLAIGALALLGACAHKAPEPDRAPETPAAGQRITLTQTNDPLPGRAFKLAYRSTDSEDPHQLVAVSAQVMLPPGTPPAGGWPVLAWAHGTTGIGLTCAPSVLGIGVKERGFYESWLKRGFAIVATDYPGMGEPGAARYLDARSEGMAVLDAVRAAQSAIDGVGNAVVIDGHSQGAQAALAASGLAADYAPGLDIRATIVISPPYFQKDSAQALFAKAYKDRHFAPIVIYGLLLGASYHENHPEFDPKSAFAPRGQAFLQRAKTECLTDLWGAAQHAGLTPATVFTRDAATALAPAVAWGMYPTLHLHGPVMLAIGTGDVQIPPALQKALAHDLTLNGTDLRLHVYPGQSHSGTLAASLPDAQRFAHDAVWHAAAP